MSYLGSPFEAIHSALSNAIHKDLDDVEYLAWSYASGQRESVSHTGRPNSDDVEVILFPQQWGSTALGYGGIGGAAMSKAYTVIIKKDVEYCVYFGVGQLAYKVKTNNISPEGRSVFEKDVGSQRMKSIIESFKYD